MAEQSRRQPDRYAPNLSRIEVRSVDYIPADERHGKVLDQFTLWFALNANIFPRSSPRPAGTAVSSGAG